MYYTQTFSSLNCVSHFLRFVKKMFQSLDSRVRTLGPEGGITKKLMVQHRKDQKGDQGYQVCTFNVNVVLTFSIIATLFLVPFPMVYNYHFYDNSNNLSYTYSNLLDSFIDRASVNKSFRNYIHGSYDHVILDQFYYNLSDYHKMPVIYRANLVISSCIFQTTYTTLMSVV